VLLSPSHCRYARVVALEIADEAQALEGEFATLAAQADPPESADERFAELLGMMLGGLEKLGVRKIDKPSKIAAGNRYPRTLSDQTAAEWRAQWASLRNLFGGDGVGIEAYLRAHDQAAVADRLRAAVRRVDAAMDLVTRPTPLLGQRVAKELLALRVLYAEDIAGALQTTIQFDENDGD
jgi:predicted lipoprotein